ncbi:FKBP-type peptidylprolyl cis-trans isomerase SlyD [Myxococcus stipitatus DSM 14675]|uniref:Peptidyl-prolyl cis-trans isomerase n=1 Tax=Myxococcus stipitatus (strain DSM 14675 / JCM 12634 / Mx s8) TaxID=1278073 RepID=L7U8X7_MYXSD|nr:peptidylprolyl isomerase [Myxococcus stipitatus]AGC45381.1 FKBP-type peptidylprolyl cis-trans isomerase SlyD [Myxococcus stipitatus DSM 14675]
MKITKDSVVSIDFKLHLGDGEVIDESDAGDPLVYLQGHEQLVPGLEKALEGKVKGDAFSVVVPPEEGYGPYDDEGIEVVPRDMFPPDLKLEAGGILTAEDPDGDEVEFLVKSVNEKEVTVDYNHPLAGKTLHFAGKVTDVRAASKEELEHGHAHGPDGHHDH